MQVSQYQQAYAAQVHQQQVLTAPATPMVVPQTAPAVDSFNENQQTQVETDPKDDETSEFAESES